jgi:hypothetical protein
MKSKTFILLLIISCVLAGAVYYNFSRQNGNSKHSGGTGTLFESLPVENIAQIIIKSSEGSVTLKKDRSVWVIDKKSGYLANFSLITKLISNLTTAKIGRSFDSSPDAKARLALYTPDENNPGKDAIGIEVILKDGKGAVLADTVIGKTREITAGAGGQYIMPAGGKNIFLVDKKFDDLGKSELDWIRKNVLEVKEEEIEKVVCMPIDDDKIVYTLKRPEKGKAPELVGMAKAEELDPSRIDDLTTALDPLSINDIAGKVNDPGLPDANYTHRFTYYFYDGEVYEFIPGQATDKNLKKFFLKITPKEVGKDQALPRLNQWVYEIPDWKFGRFINAPETLLKKKK